VLSIVRSRALTALRSVFSDPLYRGSLIMLGNSASLAIFGFVFWLVGTHSYSASAIGAYASITAGTGLLAAVTLLGLPNTITRRIATATNARQLMRVAMTVTVVIGGLLCLATVLLIGPHLPAQLSLGQRGPAALLVTGIVIATAVSTILDAALVATRATPALAIKNLIGSIIKIAVLVALARMGSVGLLLAYGLGISLSSILSGLALWRRLDRGGERISPMRLLKSHMSMTAGNYASMIMGILPSTVVPIEVLVILGATATGRFAVAFTLAGFLSVIPSTIAQVLFAETSHQGVTLGAQLRKALRGTYGLLLPPLVALMVGAPLVLRLFGAAYASTATACLRVLLLSAVFTGGTYLVDSVLIARDRIVAYTFMNGANAVLVLGCVALLLPHGLTAGAWGWTAAQGMSLLLGMVVIATGKSGRHRTVARGAGKAPTAKPAPRTVKAYEARIRELLETWPMMPTTLIAEQIGWDRPISLLRDRVVDLRTDYLTDENYLDESRSPPGKVAHCGIWFPPVEVPVGGGQTRSAAELPVLTMVVGHSRYLSALLIPSGGVEDLFAGCWQLLAGLGAVPKILAWSSQRAVGRRMPTEITELTTESAAFAAALGTKLITGSTAGQPTRILLERAYAYLERMFLAGREFTSPGDFNAQLAGWLTEINDRTTREPGRSPAELMAADTQAMLPLPSAPPVTGWRLPTMIGTSPFIRFESNMYSVAADATKRSAEIIADLSHVTVRCDGRVVASHPRSWARDQTIIDPDHLAGAGLGQTNRR
jgi:O-antigen/teichoic acid export membrane protein